MQSLLVLVIACGLNACLFKEPVFKEGFAKIDPGLAGVWASEENDADPRKTEFAVCVPLDDDRVVLHHPSAEKDGIYYEARMMKIRDHRLLQLRGLASFKDGIFNGDTERYTLLWIEKNEDAPTIRVRSLSSDAAKEKGPAEVKRLLEDPTTDWSKLFGDSTVFRRLKDN